MRARPALSVHAAETVLELDDFKLIQRIQRHPSRHRLPAIALASSQADYPDAKGFDAVLRKPPNLEQLSATILSVSARRA